MDIDNPEDDELVDIDAIPFKRRRLIIRGGSDDESDAALLEGLSDEQRREWEMEEEHKSLSRFERKYLGGNSGFGLFRGFYVYLDRFDPVKYISVPPLSSSCPFLISLFPHCYVASHLRLPLLSRPLSSASENSILPI